MSIMTTDEENVLVITALKAAHVSIYNLQMAMANLKTNLATSQQREADAKMCQVHAHNQRAAMKLELNRIKALNQKLTHKHQQQEELIKFLSRPVTGTTAEYLVRTTEMQNTIDNHKKIAAALEADLAQSRSETEQARYSQLLL